VGFFFFTVEDEVDWAADAALEVCAWLGTTGHTSTLKKIARKKTL
jgi:hypothetical protein